MLREDNSRCLKKLLGHSQSLPSVSCRHHFGAYGIVFCFVKYISCINLMYVCHVDWCKSDMLVSRFSLQKVILWVVPARCSATYVLSWFLDFVKMSLDKELSGIARFNGDEFHIWKWQMKSLLQYKKINTICWWHWDTRRCYKQGRLASSGIFCIHSSLQLCWASCSNSTSSMYHVSSNLDYAFVHLRAQI